VDQDLTILLIEDDCDAQLLLRLAFKRAGINYPVQLVANGRQAIDYLRGAGDYGDRSRFPSPDVIFTDLKLPGMSGFDLLAWIRERPECSLIPVIILSASEQDVDIRKAYQMGANAYLVKPMDIQDLEKMVRLAFGFWAACAKPRVPSGC
jgi:CheY-like chemotaxis protein